MEKMDREQRIFMEGLQRLKALAVGCRVDAEIACDSNFKSIRQVVASPCGASALSAP
jgi:hypothetical protein